MKKIAFFAAALLLPISVMATTDASADNKVVVAPTGPIQVTPSQFPISVPVVKGTVAVPAALLAGGFATLNCAHLQVYASSKEMVPCGPNSGFCEPYPKWTRHANATGNIASGQCTYALTVPGNSAFSVSAASNFEQPNNCGYTYVTSSGTGASISVTTREPKVHNFSVTGFSYQTCPH